ncbi:MAG: monooxygenase [Flavobacterium sp.]|nr:MAG: monooxygenase [Flavobacterium sp.]
MKIAIIGGSIGGLVTGISLRKLGYEVDIFERSPTEMQGRGAGLVIQPGLMDFVIENGISSSALFGVPAQERQILDATGRIVSRYGNDTSFTSWNYLWNQLKAYFPAEHYHYNSRLIAVEQGAGHVFADFDYKPTLKVDLLIGADGYSSTVREHFLPDVNPVYSGYIAYRGLIEEKDLSESDVNFFSNRFSLYPYSNSHLLAYMIPGHNGELEKGKRLLNWVWYVNKSTTDLEKVLTDKNGIVRQFSVPSGYLSDENRRDLKDRAVKELPEILSNLVQQTDNPFVQVIVDMSVPKMYNGRVVILGDAAFLVRPHTASGTAKAYEDGNALAAALSEGGDMEQLLKKWNTQQINYATRLIHYGIQLGRQSGLGH